MVEYMERFGFYSDPRARLPPMARWSPSGRRQLRKADLVNERLRRRSRRHRSRWRRGRASGDRPLQMAEVAATVAQRRRADVADLPPGGEGPRRKDHRGARPRRSSARVDRARRRPPQLTEMMTRTSRSEGTASGLSTALGVEFAGKTGTAEIDIEDVDQPALVHRLRSGRGPADRGRGNDRALHGLLRRRGCRPDRNPGDGQPARIEP